MPAHILAHLASAGVLERAGARHPTHLRVTPRFLAHAEETAGRLALRGPTGAAPALEAALAGWDGYAADVRAGAAFLRDFLGERHQYGTLRPLFPVLESFPRTSAASA